MRRQSGREEATAMSEQEEYRAGQEARRELGAARSALRHEEWIRRRLGGAFYDVLQRRRDHPEPAPDDEESPGAEGVRGG